MSEELERYEQALSSLRIGQQWDPPYQNACYERSGEKEISLVFRSDDQASDRMHDDMKDMVESIGWEMNDLGGDILPPDQAAFRNAQRKQEEARNWRCPGSECEEYIVAMPLEQGKWLNLGVQTMTLPDGDEVETETWAVSVTCHTCGKEIHMEPSDFGFLAGDEIFWRYTSSLGVVYYMQSREEIIQLIDAGLSENLILTGTLAPFSQDVFPPHMRGAPCLFITPEEEGEEE